MINRYRRGDAVYIKTQVYNTSDALVNGDTATITITDPDGTVEVSAQSMTNASTGIYSYIWQSASGDAAGFYKVHIEVTSGSYTSVQEDDMAFELY